jgi:hypothetical protein
LARFARAAADWTRERNGAELVGRVKRSPVVQKVLYRQLAEKPRVDPDDAARLRELLDDDLRRVEERFGVNLRQRWGWA